MPNLDLFSADESSSSLEDIALPDGLLQFSPCIELPMPAQSIFSSLMAETPWRAESISLYGKQHLQPRLVSWHGEPGLAYAYSGLELKPLPWTEMLGQIRSLVQALAGETFNSVLLNLYRDHRDSIGMHSDDEVELGPTPIIASLSLGETRTFVLKHKARAELAPVRIPLTSGSLLVMRGQTQRFWKHGINKETRPCGPRINLTFRQIRA